MIDTESAVIGWNPLGHSFDPVKKAGLSEKQAALMEPFMVAVRQLKDSNGLLILHDMDSWLVAQMIHALYDADGAARSPQDVVENSWCHP